MIAIVTGASSGIGRQFAKELDNKNFSEIWLIARRKERLEDLSKKLKTKTKILDYDLLDENSFLKFKDLLEKEKPKIKLLINSAGIGVNDYFNTTDITLVERMINLNILSLTKICHIVYPHMVSNSSIVNVSSVAAFIPQPKFSVYAASKSYVLSFSKSLNRELRKDKINVCALCPNPVATEFFKYSKQSSMKSLFNEDINHLVKKTLKNCYEKDIITTSKIARLILILSKIFPHSFIMWIEKVFKMY